LSRIDIAIALVLVLGGFLGYKKGFLMELFFLLAMILGVLVAFKLMGVGVDYLQREFNANRTVLPYLSFFIIFVLVVLAVTLFGRAIKNSVDQTFLGRMDSAAGAFLGVLKYAFCVSVLFWLVKSVHYEFPDRWTQGSWLYPAIAGFAPKVAHVFAGFLPFFKEIFRQF
jgi:membrane protein required for colicin V production